MIPVALASVWDAIDWLRRSGLPQRRAIGLLAVLIFSGFWSAYGWTRNYSFLSSSWHIQLMRYATAARFIRAELPPDAIVMAMHPWEVHMLSDRRTVLMPHNFVPKRLREEVETYGVTHLVLDQEMGPFLVPILQEFGIRLTPDFASQGVGVYPVTRNADRRDSQE